jgi:hypothetical protein
VLPNLAIVPSATGNNKDGNSNDGNGNDRNKDNNNNNNNDNNGNDKNGDDGDDGENENGDSDSVAKKSLAKALAYAHKIDVDVLFYIYPGADDHKCVAHCSLATTPTFAPCGIASDPAASELAPFRIVAGLLTCWRVNHSVRTADSLASEP